MRSYLYLILSLFLGSCASTHHFTIKNVQDISSYSKNCLLYSLPRTRIAVNVTAVKNKTIPGPYHAYASKFLGIEEVPARENITWDLINVELATIIEPDQEYFFLVESKKMDKVLAALTKIKSEGLILNPYEFKTTIPNHPNLNTQQTEIAFKDLVIKKDLSGKENNTKDIQNKNTLPIDFSLAKESTNIKTIEQKAEEAANFIIKIRKRRFNLVSGNLTYYPEGVALEKGIQELNKIEEEYLSLFIGKTFSDTLTHAFYYIPKPTGDLERSEICRFSESAGFEDSMPNQGQPIVLELNDMQYNSALDHLQLFVSVADSKNIIFYRIPDLGSVKIFYGSIPILESEMIVFQYGSLVPFTIFENIK